MYTCVGDKNTSSLPAPLPLGTSRGPPPYRAWPLIWVPRDFSCVYTRTSHCARMSGVAHERVMSHTNEDPPNIGHGHWFGCRSTLSACIHERVLFHEWVLSQEWVMSQQYVIGSHEWVKLHIGRAGTTAFGEACICIVDIHIHYTKYVYIKFVHHYIKFVHNCRYTYTL